ncbi:hypothetical protein H2203_001620 [Taxawa tesnikishii (nom. ined.)]|nr:hypothetical protein H2203_001620 [Dothideales sp. JES 119]
MKIAEKTGTQLHAWDETQHVIDVDGKPLDPEEAGMYAQLLWDDGLISQAFRYSEQHGSSIPVEKSLMDFFREKAEGLFTDLPAEEAAQKRKTLLNIASMWGAYIGSPVERQSLRFYWLEETIEGENPFVAETYHKILDHVAKPALDKATILYERKVTTIESSTAGSSPEKARITTSDGATKSFDEVVVTAPLGWLKRNKSAFKPGLTPRLEKAVDSIGYGCLDKVYITFPKAFWDPATPSAPRSPAAFKIDTTGSTPNVTATTQPLHQAPSSGTAAHYPGFTHWLSPTYARSTNPHQWDQQGMNMAALPDSCSHPTILFYIYGPCSQQIASLITSTPASEIDQVLMDYFKPYYSLMPGYDADSSDCKPKAVLATAWANDEFAGYGSYSNFQVGLEEGDKDIETMREGMPERSVWIAGEHTSPFVALGTSTGAYWSGEKVGERIVERYSGGT